MIRIKTFVCNPFSENTIIINQPQNSAALIIDPGCMKGKELNAVLSYIEKEKLEPVAILLTHAHPDHILGVHGLLKHFDIPVYVDPKEKGLIIQLPSKTTDITDGEVLELAGMKLEVISTPGHTPGSVCFYERQEKLLFSGDTLFAGTIGRTDLPGGDYDAIIKSIITKLMVLDGDIEVYPGHEHKTSIAKERYENPFLQPFNEPQEEIDSQDLPPITISHK